MDRDCDQSVKYDFCCGQFEKEATSARTKIGGGYLYPGGGHDAQIEFSGGWHVNGCCGGCYVLTDIKFCPFCGTALAEPNATK